MKFFTWLYAMEMNLIRSFWRKNKNRTCSIDEVLDSLVFHEDKELSREDKIQLFDALEKLEEEENSIIVMRYFENYSVEEIAEVLNISESNAKIRLFRARNKLEELIDGGGA